MKRAKEIPHVKPVPPVSKEEQAARVAQFLSQKREQYFVSILTSIIRNKNFVSANLNETIDLALAGADYALEKMFPVVKQEEGE